MFLMLTAVIMFLMFPTFNQPQKQSTYIGLDWVKSNKIILQSTTLQSSSPCRSTWQTWQTWAAPWSFTECWKIYFWPPSWLQKIFLTSNLAPENSSDCLHQAGWCSPSFIRCINMCQQHAKQCLSCQRNWIYVRLTCLTQQECMEGLTVCIYGMDKHFAVHTKVWFSHFCNWLTDRSYFWKKWSSESELWICANHLQGAEKIHLTIAFLPFLSPRNPWQGCRSGGWDGVVAWLSWWTGANLWLGSAQLQTE